MNIAPLLQIYLYLFRNWRLRRILTLLNFEFRIQYNNKLYSIYSWRVLIALYQFQRNSINVNEIVAIEIYFIDVYLSHICNMVYTFWKDINIFSIEISYCLKLKLYIHYIVTLYIEINDLCKWKYNFKYPDGLIYGIRYNLPNLA